MTIEYPDTLPQNPQRGGFNQSQQSNTIRSSVDVGEAKVRRRYTQPIKNEKWTMILNNTQVPIFQNWFNDDLLSGVNRFYFGDNLHLTNQCHFEWQDVFLSRDSTATYVDGGILKYAGINVGRYQDGVLLLEGASTNLALHSNDFTDGTWVKDDVVLTTDGTLSPDGITEATLATFTAGITGFIRQTITVSPQTPVPSSFWVKGTDGETIKIETRSIDGSSSNQVQHTLTGEWERIDNASITDWTTQTDTEVFCTLRHDTVNTADALYISFSQLEYNTVSSYIPTTITAEARSADIFENVLVPVDCFEYRIKDMPVFTPYGECGSYTVAFNVEKLA